jgi:predicted DNA-binding protein (MmcQ/YjbR family)
MNLTYYDYCLSKRSDGTFSFDEDALVFKVGGKIYILTNGKRVPAVNLKCDPERAQELRAQ